MYLLRTSERWVPYFFAWILVCLFSCKSPAPALFEIIKPESSGVNFNNSIVETDSFNELVDEYIYNGGGVGIGDFNNDGLQDLYFTGNTVSGRLYLNRGNFRFDDITEKSGVRTDDIWSSGASVADINNDGLADIYVSATMNRGTKKNKLFINQGLKDGIPVFIDKAVEFGIDANCHTTQSVFFDYDLDGDLDLYLLNNIFLSTRTGGYERRQVEGQSLTTGKLFRNNGNGTFTNVSREAGILIEGFGLGVEVFDVNKDGFPDLYISNDFLTNDVLYVNNRNGTFSNRIAEYIKHQSFSSMGMDIADANNDGNLDIITMEMLPVTNYHMKQMYGGTNIFMDEIVGKGGYERQYMRNCFQLNNGIGNFSEISMVLGVQATEWSWSVLFADFDNDGWKDIAVANGFPRDVTDHDFSEIRNNRLGSFYTIKEKLDMIPRIYTKNYFFRNKGDIGFEDATSAWGMLKESYSNGAAYVDLDNDGDLDYVANNINDPAFVMKNNSEVLYPARTWLRMKLKGNKQNIDGIGARITLYAGKGIQYWENYPVRGYISSVDPVIHFGLDTVSVIDSIHIVWPLGESQWIKNIKTNQQVELNIRNAGIDSISPAVKSVDPLFTDITKTSGIDFVHSDIKFHDFMIQRLIPHMHSNDGPALAVGDINGDHLEDIIVGNGRKSDAAIFLQQEKDEYKKLALKDTSDTEDEGILLFDADNDGDLDIYLSSGSSEFRAHSYHYQDRLFFNDGQGNFTDCSDRLPLENIAGSVVTAADFDRDGDLDLFVGGRLIPQQYPMPESSMLLQNDQGTFRDVKSLLCPALDRIGLVTCALWTDYDGDGWVDLMVSGEWMPIRLFRNVKGKFTEVTATSGLSGTEGWWRSITSGDFDRDGVIDYIVGNQGLNFRYKPEPGHPLEIIAKDFDNNGVIDPVISSWREGDYYPVSLRNDIFQQISSLKKRLPHFKDYSSATTSVLLTKEEKKDAYQAETRIFESVILVNDGKGKFTIKKLPLQAQFAPVFGILTGDFNRDHFPDALLIGNNFSTEHFNGWCDASIGVFLKGNGKGDLEVVSPVETGFMVDGDGKALVTTWLGSGQQLVVASQNNDSLKIFRVNHSLKDRVLVYPLPMECKVIYHNKDGSREIREIYYGDSYLSQSSRAVSADPQFTEKLEFVDFSGKSRMVIPVKTGTAY
jgi:hypothetical protein